MRKEKEKLYIRFFEIGDKVYRVGKKQIFSSKIINLNCSVDGYYIYYIEDGDSFFNRNVGITYFKTKEEAEQKLQENQKISEKRRLLKEYEKELNKKLNLENHIIFK